MTGHSALFSFSRSESTIDFEGHLALLFFTSGCNFKCVYCHNPELIPASESFISFEELGKVLARAKANWIDAVCITGGEPTLRKELPETLEFIKSRGFKIKLDTQGSFPETLKECLKYCDYIAMDYKMPAEQYSTVTQVINNKEKVLKSLELIINSGLDYEIRTTAVPGIHSDAVIRQMCSELKGVKKLIIQRFVPRDNIPSVELRKTEKTSPETAARLADIGSDYIKEVLVR